MQRRTFFKSVATNLAFIFVPRWARSQMAATEQPITYHDIAVVVLPESLGPKGISDTTEAFEAWLHDYKAGVDAGSGYGFTRQTVTGPNPSLHYPEQMKLLAAAAAAKGGSFASLSLADRRSILQEALLAAGVTALPRRPTGRHVAADLMAYFYSSSHGIDFRYNAAIRIADCRGLASSTKRPASLT